MSLLAGTGCVDITPGAPMFLVGYPHVPRISTGVHDPLLAAALCLRNEHAAVILIAVDLLFLDRQTVGRCREAIRTATGVPDANILISATHTHSGPVTTQHLTMADDPVVPPPDLHYLAQVEGRIVRAAAEAWETTVPARLAVASARADGVGGNRLRPDGVTDPEVGLLYVVCRDTDAPLALSLVYGMHPTVLHEDSRLISGDFPAFTRKHLAERLPGVTVLYHTGSAGNQSPRHHVTAQTFAEAERLGRRLGKNVWQVVSRLPSTAFSDEPVLAAAQRCVDLPPRRFPTLAEAESKRAMALARFQWLKAQGAGHGPVRTAECEVFGAEEVVTLARAQAAGSLTAWQQRALPAEVQALRIGDACWVGLPGEVFAEYALDIQRRALGRTFVISLANGELQGYIVTPEADATGGYEASCSMFTSDAGRILADTAVDMIRTLPV